MPNTHTFTSAKCQALTQTCREQMQNAKHSHIHRTNVKCHTHRTDVKNVKHLRTQFTHTQNKCKMPNTYRYKYTTEQVQNAKHSLKPAENNAKCQTLTHTQSKFKMPNTHTT